MCLLSKDLVAERLNGKLPPTALARFADRRLSQVHELSAQYVCPALGTSADLYWNSIDTAIQSFLLYHTVITVLICLTLVFVYALYYRPSIVAIDREIKRVREMLLLFPEDVRKDCTYLKHTA